MESRFVFTPISTRFLRSLPVVHVVVVVVVWLLLEWARLARNSNSKAPAPRPSLSYGPWALPTLRYETRRERALPPRHNEALGGVIKGLCVVIRGYDGGNISLSGPHCNVTARGPSPISSRRTLFPFSLYSCRRSPFLFHLTAFLTFVYRLFPPSPSRLRSGTTVFSAKFEGAL